MKATDKVKNLAAEGVLEIPRPDALITITVAEYHCLTKAATALEIILNAQSYELDNVVAAVRKTVQEMQRAAGAGAEE